MSRRMAGLLLLAVLALMAAAVPGLAWATEPWGGRLDPPDHAVVVDAAGLEVGVVVTMAGPFPFVRLRADGRDALLSVLGDRLFSFFGKAVYESADCSGRPWLRSEAPLTIAPLIVEVAAVGRLNELLVASGDPETRAFSSSWNSFAEPPACDPEPLTSAIVLPTRVLTDLGVFTPPFRLR